MKDIKKIVIGMSMFLLLSFLVACGLKDRADMPLLNDSVTEKTEYTSAGNLPEQNEQNFSNQDFEEIGQSVENKYKSILLGREDFISTDLENQSLNIEKIGQVVTDDDSITVSAVKFTRIDLDGDGENEMVLWLQINGSSDYGFEVLHHQDGIIYGYMLPFRAFMELKTDSTFTFSSGAADFGIGRLIFSDAEYQIEKQTYVQSGYDSNQELTVQYFENGRSCSEDAFYNAINSQDQKTDVEWYILSVDNINIVFK